MGQKQRICLVRTLIRRASVYIFDEPTSALDLENAKAVINLIRNLSKQHLVILITHNRNLLDSNDKIYEMERIINGI